MKEIHLKNGTLCRKSQRVQMNQWAWTYNDLYDN